MSRILDERDAANYPVARRVYEQTLTTTPNDACAVQGLALLTGLEQEAGLPETWSAGWAAEWRTFVAGTLSPLGTLLGTAAAILVILLVLARLATPLVVRPTTVTPRARRWVAYVSGVLALAAASAVPVILSYRPESTSFGNRALLAVELCTLAVTGGAAAALFCKPDSVRCEPTLFRVLVGTFLGAGTAIVAVRALQAPHASPAALWWWGAGLAVAGLAWLAYGRGTRLAVEVVVSKDDKASDTLSRLLLARLGQLGSEPPRGIRAPQQSDVTSLPEDALTSVPEGAAAAAVFKVLRVVRPSTPWQLPVTLGSDLAIWSLRRNGVALRQGETIITTSALELPRQSATADGASGRGSDDSLVTAVAASLLIELSRVHPELSVGLCGAAGWRGLALHTLGMDAPAGSTRRRQLLESAVEAEPKYGLARLAHLYTLPRSDRDDRARFAARMAGLLTELGLPEPQEVPAKPWPDIDRPPRGSEALHLRLLYGIGASSYNLAVMARPARDTMAEPSTSGAWMRSARATLELTRRLEVLRDDDLRPLAQALRTPTYFLLADLKDLGEQLTALQPKISLHKAVTRVVGRLATQVEDLATGSKNAHFIELQQDWRQPLKRLDYYARAAHRAAHPSDGFLDDVRWAASLAGLRSGMIEDPSFADLLHRPPTADDAYRGQFKKIVGAPSAASYRDLDPFKPWADILGAAGLLRLDELAVVPHRELVRRFKIAGPRATTWQQIAQLAVDALPDPACAQPSASLEVLGLLIKIGVASTAELREELQSDREVLYKNLVTAAAKLNVVPSRAETIESDKWRQIASAVADQGAASSNPSSRDHDVPSVDEHTAAVSAVTDSQPQVGLLGELGRLLRRRVQP